MFDIRQAQDGVIRLSGRFDASQVQRAQVVFDALLTSCVVDFADLEYISSAGLGVLLATQKRLSDAGASLKLKNMRKLVRDVFKYSRLDRIFEIEGG